MRNHRLRGIGIVSAIFLAVALVRPTAAYVSYDWYEDASGFAEAAARAKALRAPMLVYFRTDWCPYCRAFDQLLADGAVRTRLGSYVKVRINPEHGEAERELFQQTFGARGFPAVYLKASADAPPARLSTKGPAEHFLEQLTPERSEQENPSRAS